jgi:hypothetical protein
MTTTRATAKPTRTRIPETDSATLRIGPPDVPLINLDKLFRPELGRYPIEEAR